jgi:ATP-dependent Lon protease
VGGKLYGRHSQMKMKEIRRMLRTPKKDASDSKEKTSSRKQPARNRRRGGAKGDDDSVDSHGNIRNLIAYSDEEEEITSSEDESFFASASESEGELSPQEKRTIRKEARRAALKARERIKKASKKLALKKKRIVESEDEDTEEEETLRRRKRKSQKKRKEESESEEEEEEEEDEEEEDEEDEEEDEDEEEEEEDDAGPPEISISIGGFGGDDFMERMIPKRYNMKKEPEDVKKFVKLITKPLQANTIDDQIDNFKALTGEKQKQMLEALEKKPQQTEQNLMFKILTMNIPSDTQSMILAKYHSLQALDSSSGEFFKLRNWLEKVTSLPLGIYKEIPVKMDDGSEACSSFMERARRCLEEAIYGQEEAKLQIMQFIATKIANPGHRGLSLLLTGPPGIGKTSLIRNGIAKALGWPFQFISLGGDSDATTYTGHQLVYESSHAGKIANSLANAKSMSMVLMFDELDKISTTPKGEEVQNMLIHLTDPVQNEDFEDKYLTGVPLDLSKVMFVFSGNDLNKIDKVLLDRMMHIQLQGYGQKDKLAIAENFLVPTALRDVGLTEKVAISKEVLEHMLREYANEETGVRELKRCVEQIAQKINMLRIFNAKELPFYIKDFQLPFVVKKEHIDLFLKKKTPSMDISVQRMYT